MERIILTGPHSCGKTTLANALISNWDGLFPGDVESQPSLLTEVARNVMTTQGFTRADVGKVRRRTIVGSIKADWTEGSQRHTRGLIQVLSPG